MPSNDASKSVDFVDSIAGIATSDRNGKRTTAGNTPVVAMDAKFMFVEGLGFVYYLNDGDLSRWMTDSALKLTTLRLGRLNLFQKCPGRSMVRSLWLNRRGIVTMLSIIWE